MEQQSYSKDNQPADIDSAQDRLDELNEQITLIKNDLEVRTQDNFEDSSEYKAWRNRASTALGYRKKELGYITNWVGQQKPKVDKDNSSLLRLQKIASAKIIQLNYSRIYRDSADTSDNLSELESRRSILSNTKIELANAFTEIGTLSREIGPHKGYLLIAKRPLIKILESVEKELRLIKQKKREIAERKDAEKVSAKVATGLGTGEAVRFLLNIIERNSLSDSLTTCEIQTLKKIKDYFHCSTTENQ